MRSHGVPFVLALVLSATAHGQDASRTLGQAPFEEVVTPETIAHDGRVIASVAGSGEGGYDGRLHVTSLVGPVLSYHREESGLDDEGPWFDEVWEMQFQPVSLDVVVQPATWLRPYLRSTDEGSGARGRTLDP